MKSIALWLADYHLLAAALLAVALTTMLAARQPVRRMAIAKATLAALAVLAILCALPGWSLVHLLAAEAPTPPPTYTKLPASSLLPAITIPTSPADLFPSPPDSPPESAAPTIISHPSVPNAPIDWPVTAVAAQAIGSTLVLAYLASGGLYARRLRRRAHAAPPALQQLLTPLTSPAPAPQILISDAIAMPVALGTRRPAIILPASLLPLPSGEGRGEGEPAHNLRVGATAGSPAVRSGYKAPTAGQASSATPASMHDLTAILAHEWAHISAGDLRTLAASRLLLILLWPQPLFWLLRRVIRLDQETLADAAAAEVAGRMSYAEQLLHLARNTSNSPAARCTPRLAGAVGLWEGPSQLKRRVAALLDEQLTILRAASRRWRVGSAVAALIAAGLLSLVTLQREESAQAADQLADVSVAQSSVGATNATPSVQSESTTPARLAGSILFEDGRPADVEGDMMSESRLGRNSWANSQKRTKDHFKITAPAGEIWIKHFAKGYAPASAGPFHLDPGETRDDVKIIVRRGIDLPLLVTDENQRPIAKATFVAMPVVGHSSNGPRFEHVTDAQGRVIVIGVGDMPYEVELRAPGFQPLRASYDRLESEPGNPLRLEMRKARAAEGIVRNSDGSPAQGAKLICRVEMKLGYTSSGDATMATTDSEGHFTLDQLADDWQYGFLIEASDGARMVVRDLVAGVQGKQYTVPTRRDLHGRIVGSLDKLPKRAGKPFVGIRERVSFQGNDSSYDDLVGDDVFVTPTPYGGEFHYEGLLDGLVEITADDVLKQIPVVKDGPTEATIQLSPVARAAPNDGGAAAPHAMPRPTGLTTSRESTGILTGLTPKNETAPSTSFVWSMGKHTSPAWSLVPVAGPLPNPTGTQPAPAQSP